MNSKFIIKLALTAAFVAVPTAGNITMGVTSTLKTSPATATAEKAHSWARKAEKAIAKGKQDRALIYSELAVEGDPLNRDYRSLLARIYMAQGRFQSAERTYMDVIDLGQVDPRTVIGLALARIAQGKVDMALNLVDAHRSIIPASDYGLTLALAGKSTEAVEILSQAIRDANATARTRQNLALAFALSGRWREARIMAVQDMPQDRVNERIAEWAQYARPGAYETRVAGLLRVTPQPDSGQPVRLALANNGVELASAALPAATKAADAVPTGELAAIGPAPTSLLQGFDASAQSGVKFAGPPPAATIQQVDVPASATQAPLIKAPEGPIKSAAQAPVKLALSSEEPKAPASRAVSGGFLVQLGAFSTTANAKKAWEKLTNRHSVLTGFSSASSTVKVNGKTLIRLAASGFGSKDAATDVCNSIRAKGDVCMVRGVGTAAPVRLASR